jgi:hypothetical protein
MARILLGSYMVRYPLGGMMSWVLQYLVGFHRLGHEIYLVEKSGYPNACYDPHRDEMSDDCTYGTKTVNELLVQHGLADRWCYVDAAGQYHGLSKPKVDRLFATADLFIDMGTHGSWQEEAQKTACKILLDGEPGYSQMKMETRRRCGAQLLEYDFHFSTGQNVGTSECSAPDADLTWHHVFHPVVTDLYQPMPADNEARFTTVMNWQSYEPVEFDGAVYGHKDVEFQIFRDLPGRTSAALEIAVSGNTVPRDDLRSRGWSVHDAHVATISYQSFVDYITSSRGEFGVCKSGFVRTHTGWFSDRSAVYLACGKPVVLQDTGFSQHLPCGEGLFAVNNVDEAVGALETIQSDYPRHAAAAREIACEQLDAERVLGNLLHEINA